jgi:hypothetical protein
MMEMRENRAGEGGELKERLGDPRQCKRAEPRLGCSVMALVLHLVHPG